VDDFQTISPSCFLQGLLSIRLQQCGMDVRGTLARLFVHEHMRVYGDRLVYAEDVDWLQQKLSDLLRVKFDNKMNAQQLFNDKRTLFGKLFGSASFVPLLSLHPTGVASFGCSSVTYVLVAFRPFLQTLSASSEPGTLHPPCNHQHCP
jgi:hypothetical protein